MLQCCKVGRSEQSEFLQFCRNDCPLYFHNACLHNDFLTQIYITTHEQSKLADTSDHESLLSQKRNDVIAIELASSS